MSDMLWMLWAIGCAVGLVVAVPALVIGLERENRNAMEK